MGTHPRNSHQGTAVAVSRLAERQAEISVAIPEDIHRTLMDHLYQTKLQEDLTFAYWRPSQGACRYSPILCELSLPLDGERHLHGNAAFTGAYLRRALRERPDGAGIAFLHSHVGPGWQDMSSDDIVAERDRISGPAVGQSQLPLLGLTASTDGTWSARLWSRTKPNTYERTWANSVRVVGTQIATSWNGLTTRPLDNASIDTQSVWGLDTQRSLMRMRIGIVGLGSVGSIVCEALARIGVAHVTLIDHDQIETRNLDRTLGACSTDAKRGRSKVEVAARNFRLSSTLPEPQIRAIPHSLFSQEAIEAVLDCDVLLSCVDRPLPRHTLNVIAYSHLIPVVDGGILAKVDANGRPLHVDWRIHTVGPERRCLVCLGAVTRSDIALDRDGLLDDPDYIANLPMHERATSSGRNVFPFSLSVAAHMCLQLAKLAGAGERVGGIGPQRYHAYPGSMKVRADSTCDEDCEYSSLCATALSSSILLPDKLSPKREVPAKSRRIPSGVSGILARLRTLYSRGAR